MLKKAIIFMVISAVAFALLNVIAKDVSRFSVYQVVFFRAIGTLIFTIPLLIKQKNSFLGTHKKLLIIRGIIGVISLTSFFMSLNYLGVGTAVSLRYTSPIFAAVFALYFLKEKIKKAQWFMFFLAFLGVLLIKGFGVDVNLIGLIFILTSAVFHGLVFVVIRKIGDKEHPLVIINYFMMMAFIFGGLMSINNWITPSTTELLLLLSLGFFGYLGQFYMTKAFQAEETNVIAPLKYLEVIITIIIGVIWLDEIHNLWSILGVFLILIGLVYNLYLKRK